MDDPVDEPALVDLLAALDGLPPRMREVFVDHELVGRTYSAIGAGLGLTRARAQQIGQAAGERLRAELAPATDHPRPSLRGPENGSCELDAEASGRV